MVAGGPGSYWHTREAAMTRVAATTFFSCAQPRHPHCVGRGITALIELESCFETSEAPCKQIGRFAFGLSEIEFAAKMVGGEGLEPPTSCV